ncbi:hypothetical protein [Methanoregula sp.]|uniref:hypothetical protein n=1 Tax=Methanoregula sp. TaxID=2052170 RepID=UPI002D10ED06|nr:hypothetical protein [Methanoregula sp.]HVP96048.1 hypothetical protein [Methanoregula sp.]
MRKFLCILILLSLALVGSASAYNINLNCSPLTIPVGQTIKCSVDSNFPAGTSFSLNFYQKQYTSTLISSQAMTIQPNQLTQYALFDTTGLKGGTYDVEIAWNGVVAMGSDSMTAQIIQLTDRSGDLTLTSPTTQNLADALVIAGSLKSGGNNGIQIQVDGASAGRVFGPQFIPTTNNVQNGAGVFSQTVAVTQPDDYTVKFADSNGAITSVVFHVTAPTTAPTIATITTIVPTSSTPKVTYTPILKPTTKPSPLPVLLVIGAVGIGVLLAARVRKE